MNIDQIRSEIKPLDIGEHYQPSDNEKAYFQYYGIDFEDSLTGVTHFFGGIDCQADTVACHYFQKEGAQRTCFVVHGYMDHVGMFKKIIDYLLHRGCNVVAFDFPGHGMSTGESASINSFGDYVLALRQCLAYFYQKIPSPWHVIAQSMGGAVVMDYLLTEQVDDQSGPFDRVMLLAPLVRPANWRGVTFLHWLLKGFVRRISRKFSDNTHDVEFLDFVKNKDPVQAQHIPLQWISAMLHWEKRFRGLAWNDKEVLVVQGESDATVDWKHNIDSIKDKFPKAKFFRITDGRHHLAAESGEPAERLLQAADMYFDRRREPRNS